MYYSDEPQEIAGDETVNCLRVYAGRALHDKDVEPMLFVVSAEIIDAIYAADPDWLWALIACIEDETSSC